MVLVPLVGSGAPWVLGPCLALPAFRLVSMIDQNSRWQIGGPLLITFLLVSLGLVPNLDRGRLTQNWFWNLF